MLDKLLIFSSVFPHSVSVIHVHHSAVCVVVVNDRTAMEDALCVHVQHLCSSNCRQIVVLI